MSFTLLLGVNQQVMAGEAQAILDERHHLRGGVGHAGAGGQRQGRHQEPRQPREAALEPITDLAVPGGTFHQSSQHIVLREHSLDLVTVQHHSCGAPCAHQLVHRVRQRVRDRAMGRLPACHHIGERHCLRLVFGHHFWLHHHCPLLRCGLLQLHILLPLHRTFLFLHLSRPLLALQFNVGRGAGDRSGSAACGDQVCRGNHAHHIPALCGQQVAGAFQRAAGVWHCGIRGDVLAVHTARPGGKPVPGIQGLRHLLVEGP
mmetsp:Transcript_78137/g.187390  ORF Transcript_78137/g.187390 Transcript_78137/m.187390 type:complete len:260 (+) Transcript_78137:81-860(+)